VAGCLALVLAALALAETIKHLVLTGRRGELGVAVNHLRLALLKLSSMASALGLDVLEEHLTRQQLRRTESFRFGGKGSMFDLSPLEMGVGGVQVGLRAGASGDRLSQLLLSQLLAALAYRTHALEPESKRGSVHGLVIGERSLFLRCRSTARRRTASNGQAERRYGGRLGGGKHRHSHVSVKPLGGHLLGVWNILG
jgi:hypothetical protein